MKSRYIVAAGILEDNWYHDLDTVQQELNAEDAIRMGLPLRIFNALQALPLCAGACPLVAFIKHISEASFEAISLLNP